MSLFRRLRDHLFGRDPATGEDAYFADGRAWTAVTSSNVRSIAYFNDISGKTGGVLGVRFKVMKQGRDVGTSEYRYSGVPLAIFSNMFVTGSKGKFVWTDLRDRYRYRRVS